MASTNEIDRREFEELLFEMKRSNNLRERFDYDNIRGILYNLLDENDRKHKKDSYGDVNISNSTYNDINNYIRKDLLKKVEEIENITDFTLSQYNIDEDDFKHLKENRRAIDKLGEQKAEYEDLRRSAANDGDKKAVKRYDKKLLMLQKKYDALNKSFEQYVAKKHAGDNQKIQQLIELNNNSNADVEQSITHVLTLEENLKSGYDYIKKINEEEAEYRRNLKKHEREWYESITTSSNLLTNEIKKAWSKWLEMEASAKNTAKAIGYTKEQAVAYQKAISNTAKELANTYGLTFEQTAKLQNSYNDLTNRATILNRENMKNIASISTLVGDDTARTILENMDKLGGSADAATLAFGKAYGNAAKLGLNAVKTSSAFAKNMSMANKFSFKNGVDGISKMTALSMKLKFNLESMGSVIDKFSSIEGSIDTAAKMQMMGGEAAMLFSNPMEAMNMALNDPEALIQRITNTFDKKGNFNKTTGEAEIKGYNLQWVRKVAEQMGLSAEEAVQMAKQKIKISAIDAQMSNSTRYDKDLKDIIENKAEYNTETGKFYITYQDNEGKQKDVNVDEIDNNDELKEILKSQKDPQADIQAHVRQLASDLTSIKGKIEGFKEGISIAEGQVVENTGVGNFARNIFEDGGKYNNILKGIGSVIQDGMYGTMGYMILKSIFPPILNMFSKRIPIKEGVAKGLAKMTTKGKPTVDISEIPETLEKKNLFVDKTPKADKRWLSKMNVNVDEYKNMTPSEQITLRARYEELTNTPSSRSWFSRNNISNPLSQPQASTPVNPGQIGGQPYSSTNSPSATSPTGGANSNITPRSQSSNNTQSRSNILTKNSKIANIAKYTGKGLAVAGLVGSAFDAIKSFSDAKEKQEILKNEETQNRIALYKNEKEDKDGVKTTQRIEDLISNQRNQNLARAVTEGAGAILTTFGGPVGMAVGTAIGSLFGRDSRDTDELIQEDYETQKFGVTSITDGDLQNKANLATVKMHDILVSIWYHLNGKQSNGAIEEKGIWGNLKEGNLMGAVGSVFQTITLGIDSLSGLFGGSNDRESKSHYYAGAKKNEGDIDTKSSTNSHITVNTNSEIGRDLEEEGSNSAVAVVNTNETVIHKDKITKLGDAYNDLVSNTNAAPSITYDDKTNTVSNNSIATNNKTNENTSLINSNVLNSSFGGNAVSKKTIQENNQNNVDEENISTNVYDNGIRKMKGDNTTILVSNGGIKEQYSVAPIESKPVVGSQSNTVNPTIPQPNFNIQAPTFTPSNTTFTLNGRIELFSNNNNSSSAIIDVERWAREHPNEMNKLTNLIMQNWSNQMSCGQRKGQSYI